MRSMIAGFAFVTVTCVAAAVGPARASGGCSSDAFAVKGSALGVELCAPATPAPKSAGKPSTVVVTETLTAKGQPPLVRRATVELVAGEDTAHWIDDAPLQGLGIAGTLHMTIAYRAGAVHLEHALLVPGAIALK